MTKPSPISEAWRTLQPFDLVRVPFPFSDRAASKMRPALVLSRPAFHGRSGHLLLAMVTSSAQAPWPLDWTILDLQPAGLKLPALVRMKLFTLDGRLLREPLGRLGEPDRLGVTRHLKELIGW